MKEAWTAVFDCRYELKNMTRKAADQAIATVSLQVSKALTLFTSSRTFPFSYRTSRSPMLQLLGQLLDMDEN